MQELADERPEVSVSALAPCVLWLSGAPGSMLAWLEGACMGDRMALSADARARLARVDVGGSVPDLFSPLAGLGQRSPLSRRETNKGLLRVGLATAGVGVALVGGTAAWHQTAEGTTDQTWALMWAVNTAGWVAVLGGGGMLVGSTF